MFLSNLFGANYFIEIVLFSGWIPDILGSCGWGAVKTGEWISQLYAPSPDTLTKPSHTQSGVQRPCQPSRIPLPNCLISWIVLNPH